MPLTYPTLPLPPAPAELQGALCSHDGETHRSTYHIASLGKDPHPQLHILFLLKASNFRIIVKLFVNWGTSVWESKTKM